MNPKLPSALGLCKKAGKLVSGFDAAADAIKQGKACLLLLAGDISPKSAREITRLALKQNIPAVTLPMTMDEMWYTLGKRAGILAVADRELAKLISGHCQNEEEKSL